MTEMANECDDLADTHDKWSLVLYYRTGQPKRLLLRPHDQGDEDGDATAQGKKQQQEQVPGELQSIQWTGAIAPNEHPLRCQILHRVTSGVKFNRAIVIGSELVNGNKILNKSRGNKDIIKR